MVRKATVLLLAVVTLLGLMVMITPAKATPLSAAFEIQDWHCAVGGKQGWVVSISGATLNPSGDTRAGVILGGSVTLNGVYGHNDFYSGVSCKYRYWWGGISPAYPGIGVNQGVWIYKSGQTFRI